MMCTMYTIQETVAKSDTLDFYFQIFFRLKENKTLDIT